MAKRRESLSTPTAQAFEFKPARGEYTIARKAHHFTRDAALDVIRDELRNLRTSDIVVIRGKGGTAKYKDEWWSSVPTDASSLLAFSGIDLARYLYDLQEVGPSIIDIYHRTE